MHRRALALAALLICGLLPISARASSTSPAPARVTQVDASRYPEVTVYVRVEDEAGALVPGLSADDFAITEGGRAVGLTGFAGGGASPVTTLLVIDRSGSMDEAGKLRGAQEAARAFVGQMRPGDRTALLPFSSAPDAPSGFGGTRAALLDAVDALDADGGTAVYDSVIAAAEALRGESGRRAILLLTDGQDCRDDPECPDEYGSRSSADQAIAAAQETGLPVIAIGLGDHGAYGSAGIDEDVLQLIAGETGGEYIYAPDAARLADVYRGLSAGIQSEYALTYRSPRPFYDGTRRDIAVSVGGAPAAQAGYLQRNLIDVRSNPVVGFVLLVPLLWALLLPGALRRRRGVAPADPPAPTSLAQPPAEGATIVSAPAASRSFCIECGRPLRQAARYCSGCGAPVEVIA